MSNTTQAMMDRIKPAGYSPNTSYTPVEYQLLDHGYLRLVDHWGSEEDIIRSARMSTNKGFIGWDDVCVHCSSPREQNGNTLPRACTNPNRISCEWGPGDEKLLAYLWKHHHETPFEMAGMTFEVQAPIFVFREWHRHRVPFGYNELSSRYSPLPDVNYIPSVERLLMSSKTNKQAGTVKGSDVLDEAAARRYQEGLRLMYERQQTFYQVSLECGVPKELARIHLPVGRYSRMRATGNLRGWLGFLKLRMALTAQFEIRVYANAICQIVEHLFPRTWNLFIHDLKRSEEFKEGLCQS